MFIRFSTTKLYIYMCVQLYLPLAVELIEELVAW